MDARIVDHQVKTVATLEMSCPWIQNREKKDEEKVLKYGPLYRVTQYRVFGSI